MKKRSKKCFRMDKNVYLRTDPKWTSRNNINSFSNNNNSITNFSRSSDSYVNRRKWDINASRECWAANRNFRSNGKSKT